MKTKDSLTEHYMPLVEGSYDCIDRIVLNAYCPMLLRAGGLRNWYRIMEAATFGTIIHGNFCRLCIAGTQCFMGSEAV
jgi:hypothetical protein